MPTRKRTRIDQYLGKAHFSSSSDRFEVQRVLTDVTGVVATALRYFADLNGSEWIKGDDPGAVDMRQRAKALQAQLCETLKELS